MAGMSGGGIDLSMICGVNVNLRGVNFVVVTSVQNIFFGKNI